MFPTRFVTAAVYLSTLEAECEAHTTWLQSFARNLLANRSTNADHAKRKRAPSPDTNDAPKVDDSLDIDKVEQGDETASIDLPNKKRKISQQNKSAPSSPPASSVAPTTIEQHTPKLKLPVTDTTNDTNPCGFSNDDTSSNNDDEIFAEPSTPLASRVRIAEVATTTTTMPSPRQPIDDPRLKSIVSSSIENLRKGLTSLNEKRKTALTTAAGQLAKTPAKPSRFTHVTTNAAASSSNSYENVGDIAASQTTTMDVDETSDMDVDSVDFAMHEKPLIEEKNARIDVEKQDDAPMVEVEELLVIQEPARVEQQPAPEEDELDEEPVILPSKEANIVVESKPVKRESNQVVVIEWDEVTSEDRPDIAEQEPVEEEPVEDDDDADVIIVDIPKPKQLPLPKSTNKKGKTVEVPSHETHSKAAHEGKDASKIKEPAGSQSKATYGGPSTYKKEAATSKKNVTTDQRIERAQQRRIEDEAKRAEEAKRREEEKARRTEMSAKKEEEPVKKKQRVAEKQTHKTNTVEKPKKHNPAKAHAGESIKASEPAKPIEQPTLVADFTEVPAPRARDDKPSGLPMRTVEHGVVSSVKADRVKTDSVGSTDSSQPRTKVPVPEPIIDPLVMKTPLMGLVPPKPSILKSPAPSLGTLNKGNKSVVPAALNPPILNPILDLDGMTSVNTAMNAAMKAAGANIKAESVKRPDSDKSKKRSGPTTIVDEQGDLPEIPSDEEDEDDDSEDDERVKPARPTWAETPNLMDSLKDQQARDPDQIFGSVKPISLEEVFKGVKKVPKFRPRSSSANWLGADELTAQEEDSYKVKMGFGPS
ncbi:hypothetical protein SmJEL517_g01064 [Synchytrium microbalum]|uniref:Inner centromere protein ARK-binding domain-containing protein n=1 Tax=Synchytrium microbalum TaxID=1806994 RepID=A0A507CH77_9FUNG|nr:uncharacterized protein SmJEL517_g01064 [Synchytrium microbalum]TPX37015.1 hypothetical protein SmJEL517_g01064 [Synchytrium microbalum]